MQIAFDISESDFEWIKKWAKDGTNIPVYDTLAKYIANAKVLPEENEQKTGKWEKRLISTVPFTIYFYECPFCEFRTATNSFRYCPNCGEKLEVDENG